MKKMAAATETVRAIPDGYGPGSEVVSRYLQRHVVKEYDVNDDSVILRDGRTFYAYEFTPFVTDHHGDLPVCAECAERSAR